jgi:polygalacturonase
LLFDDVDGVSIIGNGILDGQGTSLWDCKNSGKSCPMGATV